MYRRTFPDTIVHQQTCRHNREREPGPRTGLGAPASHHHGHPGGSWMRPSDYNASRGGRKWRPRRKRKVERDGCTHSRHFFFKRKRAALFATLLCNVYTMGCLFVEVGGRLEISIKKDEITFSSFLPREYSQRLLNGYVYETGIEIS